MGDANRLRQILIHLVGNALKFSTQGYVAVRVRKIRSGYGKPFLRFAVQDTGGGIEKQELRRLFEPFVRGRSRRKKLGGTGIGLALCRHLVNLMGGKIWAESTLGRGSSFFFTIPSAYRRTPPPPTCSLICRKPGANLLLAIEGGEFRRSLPSSAASGVLKFRKQNPLKNQINPLSISGPMSSSATPLSPAFG